MDLAEVERALRERREGLAAELEKLTEIPRDPMAAVSFGKRIGDGTTEAVERLSRVGAAKSLASTLSDVDRALQKIAEGTYGTCDSCGREIPRERLEAIPATSLCVDCRKARSS